MHVFVCNRSSKNTITSQHTRLYSKLHSNYFKGSLNECYYLKVKTFTYSHNKSFVYLLDVMLFVISVVLFQVHSCKEPSFAHEIVHITHRMETVEFFMFTENFSYEVRFTTINYVCIRTVCLYILLMISHKTARFCYRYYILKKQLILKLL